MPHVMQPTLAAAALTAIIGILLAYHRHFHPPTTSVQHDWRWTREPCIVEQVEIQLTPTEQQSGRLHEHTLAAAVNTFKRCGVVVLKDVMPVTDVLQVNEQLRSVLQPYLQCRAQVRTQLHHAIHARIPPHVLWEQVKHKQLPCFDQGYVFRERNDNRIDVTLNATATSLMNVHVIETVLKRLLGGDSMRLTSTNAVVALPGAIDQHWHRDSGLLFEPEVHSRTTGVHLPPFAINAFIPLNSVVDAHNGATEFTLGSHLWSDVWSEDEQTSPPPVDRQFTLKQGSVLLFDYRTVHRGRANRSSQMRSLLMLVYGRSWWRDPVNYATNYGGLNKNKKNMNADELRHHMFTHLIRLWSPSLSKI